MITFYHAYTLDELCSIFEKVWVETRGNNPLKLLPVLTINRDIGRWSQLQFTRKLGVNTNLKFKLPAAFIHELNYRVNPGYEKTLINKNLLRWYFFKIFDGLPENDVFEPIHSYVGDSNSRRYQLATETADLFDRYMLYRPEILSSWGMGNFDIAVKHGLEWQARLWNDFKKNHPSFKDRNDIIQDLIQSIFADRITLPDNLFLFATDNLPPLYIKVFEAISKKTHIHWFRIRHHKNLLTNLLDSDSYNSSKILRLLSEEQKSFDAALNETIKDYQTHPVPEKVYHSNSSLHRVQNALRGYKIDKPIKDKIESITINACHGKLREIQVMKNEILNFLAQNPDAGPQDVLVVAPNIQPYESFIAGEFSQENDDMTTLSWRVTTPFNSILSKMVEAISQAMDISREDYKSIDVLHWLQNPLIAEKLEINTDDLNRLNHWLKSLSIRWGYDSKSRIDDGVFSWRFNLDRILAGSLVPLNSMIQIDTLFTWNGIEGDAQFSILGKIDIVIRRLQIWKTFSQSSHTLKEWVDSVISISKDLLPSNPDHEKDLFRFYRILEQLKSSSGFYEDKISFEIFKDEFLLACSSSSVGSSYRSGSILFSNMVPVRYLPFRFIGILGMDEDTYPGSDSKRSFDLTEKEAKPGDRSRRETNKALFLDFLMAPKSHLAITFNGYQYTDAKVKMPSLVVSELMEYANSTLSDANQLTITRHKMHAFNKIYFDSKYPEFFCYSRGDKNTSAKFYANSEDLKRSDFIDLPLKSDLQEIEIHLNDLKLFFEKNYTWFLTQQLGIRKSSVDDKPEKRDLFTLNNLDLFVIRGALLEEYSKTDTANIENIFNQFYYTGQLPYGVEGRQVFDELLETIQSLVQTIKDEGLFNDYKKSISSKTKTVSKVLSIAGKQITISCPVSENEANTRIRFCYSKKAIKHVFKAWIENLFLNTIFDDEKSITIFHATDKAIKVYNLNTPNSEAILKEIIGYYISFNRMPDAIHPDLLKLIYEYTNENDVFKAQKIMDKIEEKFEIEGNYNYGNIFNLDDNTIEFVEPGLVSDNPIQTLKSLVNIASTPFFESLSGDELE